MNDPPTEFGPDKADGFEREGVLFFASAFSP